MPADRWWASANAVDAATAVVRDDPSRQVPEKQVREQPGPMDARELPTEPGATAKALRREEAAPAVTIIIPTYNRRDLLPATLDSVAAQTFKDYEITVVDDGSSDDTRQYIASRPERISYHWQPNQGVAKARNHGLRHTRAEFVAFLDSDDYWQPTFLEETVGRLRREPALALVFTRFTSMNPEGRVLRRHNKQPHSGEVTAALFASTFIHTSSVVARAWVVRDAGGFDERLTHNEDYDLWLRLSLRHRFGMISEPLCMRRCHMESLSHNGCTPDVLLRKADLLHRFYEAGGGKPRIEPHVANRRLGKVYYTAGKALYRSGRIGEAHDTLRRSLDFNPTRMRTWLWYMLSSLGSRPHRMNAPAARRQ